MRSSAIARPQDPAHHALRVWLYLVAGLVFAIVLVGGATRLTESGLSIVEWKPITGVVPPMGEGAWQAEFQQYQTIPQFRSLNADMTLPQFKTIYWWEWTHRLLGRVIGAAFLLPFLWFLWRGAVPAGTKLRLWGIFGLGAFQGAVGWWMVASGLADRVSVSQYRLAFHLTLACLIYSAMLWTAQRLSPRVSPEATPRLRASSVALVVLVLGQLYLGALVAGLDAGRIYNTWPLIDGGFIPDSARLFFDAPLWRNFFENALTVQFDHRMLAYLIFALAWLHALDAWRGSADHRTRTGATILALAVTVQAGLGITTLLMQAPLDLSIVHQAMAMVVLTVAVVHAAWMYPRRVEAVLPAAALAPSSR